MWALVTAGTPMIKSFTTRAELHIADEPGFLPSDDRVIVNNPIEVTKEQADSLAESARKQGVWVCWCGE